jgi:dissimilatory sulfite reductase (desulfoviridin) alpha/beta subunit
MYEGTAQEGRITVAIVAQIHWAVWACVGPVLCQFALLDVPPQAHEGMTLRIIGPTSLL